MWVIHKKTLASDGTLTIDCILNFRTVVLLYCSLNRCMHLAWVFEYLLICVSWPHTFWIKISKIYQRTFSGVSKEASLILDPRASTNNTLNRRGKNIRQFIQKWVRKIEIKILDVLKRYALTYTRKNLQRFWRHLCFNKV